LVLLAQNATDVTDAVRRGGMERFSPDGTVVYPNAGPARRLLLSSAWACFYLEVFRHYHWLYLTPEVFEARMERLFTVQVPDLVDRYRNLSQKDGFSFAVIFQPMRYEVISGGYCRDSRLYLDALKGTGVPVVDLLPFFLENGAQEDLDAWFWSEDGHLKPEGYEAMAGAVRRELAARGLLPAGS
ncbi:MAG: hypothetical protein KKA60_00265, partial [Proteobacteria bacterium]|nr:hypothetical protein [Pseudomonadota bacterium]